MPRHWRPHRAAHHHPCLGDRPVSSSTPSRIERRPRAPVLRSRARLATAFKASARNSRSTPSISNSFASSQGIEQTRLAGVWTARDNHGHAIAQQSPLPGLAFQFNQRQVQGDAGQRSTQRQGLAKVTGRTLSMVNSTASRIEPTSSDWIWRGTRPTPRAI